MLEPYLVTADVVKAAQDYARNVIAERQPQATYIEIPVAAKTYPGFVGLVFERDTVALCKERCHLRVWISDDPMESALVPLDFEEAHA